MKKLLLLLLFPLTLFGQSQKISDMASATTLAGTEYVPIVQTTNKKATVSLLRGFGSYGTAGQYMTVNGTADGFTFVTPPFISAYPGAGIAVSTGSAWGTSITDNSANWNTAFGWGNHASAGYLTSVGTGVTNQLTYWSGTNAISSLSTATYPSLTELSYVKGVTSAIQTQLDAKLLKAGDTYTTTTGNGLALTSSTVTSGNLVSLSNTGTAAASNTKTVLNISSSGANATSTQTTYGLQVSNTNTGTLSTNYGIYTIASGATNNYSLYSNGQTRINDLLFVGGAALYTTAASTRLDIRGATTVAAGVAIGNAQTSSNTSVNHDHLSIQTAWSGSSVTNAFRYFSGTPTINITSGTGTLIGYNWNPTLTSVAGISNHYSFYASSGDLVIASGNALISGNYTTQGQVIQNVGTTGSDLYRRKVEWTPTTASGSSGNFDFNIFNTDVITNSTCTVTITITGVSSDGVKSYAKEMKATFRKPGTSDPVQVGSTSDIYEHSNDLTTPTSSVSASTDFCRISYDSGTGAPTLRWTIFIETKYSTN